MKNGTDTLETNWSVPYKTKYTLTIQSSNCTPWDLARGLETMYPHRNLHTDSNFMHNFQNLEQPRYPSVGQWINYNISRQ